MPKRTQNEMENAIKADQEDKMSMRRAGATYGATYTTLNNKLTGKYCNANGAHETAISRTFEALLVTVIDYDGHRLWIA